MDSETCITSNELVKKTMESMTKSLGIHVVIIIIEHALWKTRHKYEEAHLIRLSEENVYFDQLDKVSPEIARSVIQEFLFCIIDSLGNLVGEQMASSLASGLNWGGNCCE